MGSFKTIYLKQLDDISEIYDTSSKWQQRFKKIILLIKQIFGIITVKEGGMCVVPYISLTKHYKIKIFFIKRFVKRINRPIILSNYLDSIMDLKVNLARENEIIDGRKLANYIVIEVIEYICKITNEDLQKQDITLLIQNETADVKKMIIDIAKNVKRIQIVSPKINQFNNLENELEDKYGVACLITNNKRKSLLRSRIIVNIDYSEDMINQFVINKNAIIMDINNNLNIYAKSFSGIHIYNYNIRSNIANNSFDVKKIIQARLEGKTYEQIRDFLHNNEVRIINLVGKNGIINTNEFKNLAKKA